MQNLTSFFLKFEFNLQVRDLRLIKLKCCGMLLEYTFLLLFSDKSNSKKRSKF